MNKIFSKITLMFAVGAVLVGFSSCSDRDDEVMENNLARLYMPYDLEIKTPDKTTAEVKFMNMDHNVEKFVLEAYINDAEQKYDSEGATPDVTVEQAFDGDIDNEQVITLEDLEADVAYSVRVKAVSTALGKESKWAKELIGSNIFNKVLDADKTTTSIKVSWWKNFPVTRITVKEGKEELVNRDLTDEEIANCEATFEGLKPYTKYTFNLYNETKEKGDMDVMTQPNFVEVNTGDDLQAAIDALEEGQAILLKAGEHTPSANLQINKTTYIKGEDGAVLNTAIYLNEKAGMELANVKLNGSLLDKAAYAFNYGDTEGSFEELNVHDCEICNYEKGLYVVNNDGKKQTLKSVVFDNDIIHDFKTSSSDFGDIRTGYAKSITMTNSTFYNVATGGRDFFRHDAAEANYPDVTAGPAYKVDHCTFYKIGGDKKKYRFFYLRFANNTITFTNNIISDVNYLRGFANQSTTCQTPELKKNFYYNTENLLTQGGDNTEKISWFDTKGTELTANPFANAEAYDFTVSDATLKKVGDPRWAK